MTDWGFTYHPKLRHNSDQRKVSGGGNRVQTDASPFRGLVPATKPEDYSINAAQRRAPSHVRWKHNSSQSVSPHDGAQVLRELQQGMDLAQSASHSHDSANAWPGQYVDHPDPAFQVSSHSVDLSPPPLKPTPTASRRCSAPSHLVFLVVFLCSLATVAILLPDRTQPLLRALQDKAKAYAELAETIQRVYDTEHVVLPPNPTPQPVQPPRSNFSKEFTTGWYLNSRTGTWMPKHGRRDVVTKVGMQILAKEGTSWQMDGQLRMNSFGDYIEALLPPYLEGDEAHASNLVVTPTGDLLCAWFSGMEGQEGTRVVLARLPARTLLWGKPQLVNSETGRSLQNPVMYFDEPNNNLYLIHTSQAVPQEAPPPPLSSSRKKKGRVGKNAASPATTAPQVTEVGQGTAELYQLVAPYGPNLEWSMPLQLSGDFQKGAFARNQLLKSRDGNEWLLPMYYTPMGTGPAPHQRNSQFSALARRQADSSHWEVLNMTLPGQGLVQPSVLRLKSGNLLAFFRDRDASFIHMSTSTDDGRSWSLATRTTLPNSNKAIAAIQLASGNLMIVFNNNAGERNVRDKKMWPISVALSVDEGRVWKIVRDLEEDFDPLMEYSYPSVIQTDDEWIHVTYTWSYRQVKRMCIRYVSFKESWIIRHVWQSGPTKGLYLGGLLDDRR